MEDWGDTVGDKFDKFGDKVDDKVEDLKEGAKGLWKKGREKMSGAFGGDKKELEMN